MQAGKLKPDSIAGFDAAVPEFKVSYKRQMINWRFPSTVRDLLHKRIPQSYMDPQFISDVVKPLTIEQLMDQKVEDLSGGELQRVELCLCLGKVRVIFTILRS